MADRLDVGVIGTKIRPIDEEIVQEFANLGYATPNYVMSFYKVRRGKYAGTKLWCHIDLGTCTFKGLFITDSQNKPLPIEKKTIQVIQQAEKKKKPMPHRKSAF